MARSDAWDELRVLSNVLHIVVKALLDTEVAVLHGRREAGHELTEIRARNNIESLDELGAEPLGKGRRLGVELLEGRRLLSALAHEQVVELSSTSPALFVENQGQWTDESVRFLHQGDGVNVAMTDAGPVFRLFQREEAECLTFNVKLPCPEGRGFCLTASTSCAGSEPVRSL